MISTHKGRRARAAIRKQAPANFTGHKSLLRIIRQMSPPPDIVTNTPLWHMKMSLKCMNPNIKHYLNYVCMYVCMYRWQNGNVAV